MLTILCYALFTGLSFFAQTWWQLLIFRFVAALGIGGEWAVGASLLSSLLGLGNVGDAALNMGAQMLTLKFSREDETEADIVGLDLAARAGYDPGAGVTLWQKMMGANKNAPPEFMSTHPAGDTRIRDIQGKLPKVAPLYARAGKPDRQFAPPPKA